jgi:hypothetical protein
MCETFPPNKREVCLIARASIKVGSENRLQWDYMSYYPTDDEVFLTAAVSSLFLIVFVFACTIIGQKKIHFHKSTFAAVTNSERLSYRLTLLIILPVALYSTIIAIDSTNSYTQQWESDAATGVSIYTNTTSYIVDAHNFLGGLVILTAVIYRFRLIAFVPAVLFFALRLYLGGGRWAMVMVAYILALLLCAKYQRKVLSIKYLVYFMILFPLFGIVGENRAALPEALGIISPDSPAMRAPLTLPGWLDGPDFANFEFLAYVVHIVPDFSKGYSYFSQHLELFTRPIPRILWPGKPVGSVISLVDLNSFGNFFGLTTGIPGDGWLSFGWLGVVIDAIFAAYLTAKVYNWFTNNNENAGATVMYCIFLGVLILYFRDGVLLSILLFGFWLGAPVLLWMFLSRVLRGKDERRVVERASRS